MHIFIAVFGAIFALMIIIILHEYGHFLMARFVGIHVERFSIGFGPSLIKHISKKTGTEFRLALIPLGGYVKMQGDNEGDPKVSDPKSYYGKSVWKRMAVVLAGPAVNFILAFVIFCGIYSAGITHVRPIVGAVSSDSIAATAGLQQGQEIVRIDRYPVASWQQVMMAVILRVGDHGDMTFVTRNSNNSKNLNLPANLQKNLRDSTILHTHALNLKKWKLDMLKPDPFSSLGFQPFSPKTPAVIAKVLSGSAAQNSGLQLGDKILEFNKIPVLSWVGFVNKVKQNPNKKILLKIKRNDKIVFVPIKVGVRSAGGKSIGTIGVMAKMPPMPKKYIHHVKYSWYKSWYPAFHQCWLLLHFNIVMIGKMLTGKVSLKALGGPITIFSTAGRASLSGILVYSSFIAFVSLMIGFINILPIPGLDGGHFLFQLVEVVIRRPVSALVQMWSVRVGFFCLVYLMVMATVNDILRLF